MKKIFILITVSFASIASFAQAVAYSDPAQAYVKLLLDKDASTFSRIDGFKVIGTCYLFGEKNTGSVFAKEGKAINISLSYNTYNQQVEVYSEGQEKPIYKDWQTIDSFFLKSTHASSDYKQELQFVNAKLIGSQEKGFMQIVYTGLKFTLLKKYKSELGYSSTNYIQSDLRQFDLNYDYFYLNNQTKAVTKLRKNSSSIRKEFKFIKDIDTLVNDDVFTTNQEAALVQLFVVLNN